MATKRNLNPLFRRTEPAPASTAAAAPSISAVSDTVEPITGTTAEQTNPGANPFDMVPLPGFEDIAQPAAKKPLKPQSVYLTKSELAYIQDIANAYGESRHSVLQYAVKELIRDWKRGKKPRTNILGKLDK